MAMTDEILIKFLLKETSDEENRAVEKWLAADPAHVSEFLELEKIWESSQLLAPKSTVNEAEAWISFQDKVKKKKQEKETAVIVPLRRNYTWISVAAVFLLAFGSWMLYQVFSPVTYTLLNANQEILTQKLPDGSELILNKRSALSYATNFTKDRSIRLDSGDVFFQVAPDKSHPFIIQVDQVSVKVVGTSFNVKHLNQQTEVIVETGIVKVSLGGETVELVKGERILISGNTKKLVKEQNKDELYNYYRTKLFVLRNTPLWKLAQVLNEAYDVKISVDPALRNLTYNTTLKLDAPLDYNLGIICMGLNLTYSSNGKDIVLSNKK